MSLVNKPLSSTLENEKNEGKLVFSIFLFAVTIRFLYIYFFYGFNTLPGMDEIIYHKIAGNISDGLGFVIKEGVPTTKKPPIYPYFMAVFYLLFGKGNFMAIRIAQIIIGGLCTVLVYFISKKFAGKRVAIISSILVSADPILIYFSAWILAHILVYFFIALAVLFCLKTIENPSLHNTVLSGFFWGLVGLSMGYNTFLFYPYLFLWGLVIFRYDRKKALKISAILLLGTVLTVSAWTVRNYMSYKKFIPIVTSGGHRFLGSNNPRANGLWTPASGSPRFYSSNKDRGWGNSPDWELWASEADALWLDLLFSEKKDYNDYEVNLINYKTGWEWIKNNPSNWLKLLPKKFYHLWEPFNPHSTFPHLSSVKRMAVVVFYSLIFPFFITGLYLSVSSWEKYLILYLTIIHSIIGVLIYYGDAQQRAIITPFLSVFAALALNKLWVMSCELWAKKTNSI